MHSLHVSLNKYTVFMALGKIPKINSRSSDFLPDLLREHQTCKELWIPQTILPSEHLQSSYIKLSRSDLLDFESSNLQGKFIPHTPATNLQRSTCLYIRLSQLMPAFLRKLVSPPTCWTFRSSDSGYFLIYTDGTTGQKICLCVERCGCLMMSIFVFKPY